MSRLIFAPAARVFVALALASGAAACGSDAVTPTPIDPGAPTISCSAAPPSVQSLDGKPVSVGFAAPTVSGGTSPLVGPVCTPASGSAFGVGATPVTCTVTDAKARTNSCTVLITVLGPPKLSLTRFVAYGDSMTTGEIPSEGILSVKRQVVPRLVDPYLNYTAELSRDLYLRYQTQSPGVVDLGMSGQVTSQGLALLPGALVSGNNYQVLLLMEGANDLPGGSSFVLQAASNMDAMIRIGKGAGLRVFLANLPPQNPNACTGSAAFSGCIARNSGAPYVVSYNGFMAGIASNEGVPLVDVYSAFNGDVTTLIDTDGLHPTPAGYKVIADAFFASIQKNLEVAATANPSLLQKSLFALPWRR